MAATVLVVVWVGAGCSEHSTRKPVDPNDPFSDPFFTDEEPVFRSHAAEIPKEAPSVGAMSDAPDKGSDRAKSEREALERSGFTHDSDSSDLLVDGLDPVATASDPAKFDSPGGSGKTFRDKAEEATLATLSVLIGLGSVALPFIVPGV
jgi:hypothetical protein